MFILRRAILVLVGLTMYNYSYIQLQILLGCNIVFLIYFGSTQVYYVPLMNRLEFNTEMFIAIISYHLITFTDFVSPKGDGLKTRVLMGYSFIFFVSLLVFVNLYFVFKIAVNTFKLKGIRLYRRYLLKYKPEEFKIHQE